MGRWVYRRPSLRAWVNKLKRGRGPVIPGLAVPYADFSVFNIDTLVSAPVNVQFFNFTNAHAPPNESREPFGGFATSFSWDFGDGGTSTLEHPSHFYSQNGTYTVTLEACNSAGCNTMTRVDYIVLVRAHNAVIRRLRSDERVSASLRSAERISASLRAPERVSISGLRSRPAVKIRRLRSDDRVSASLRSRDV